MVLFQDLQNFGHSLLKIRDPDIIEQDPQRDFEQVIPVRFFFFLRVKLLQRGPLILREISTAEQAPARNSDIPRPRVLLQKFQTGARLRLHAPGIVQKLLKSFSKFYEFSQIRKEQCKF